MRGIANFVGVTTSIMYDLKKDGRYEMAMNLSSKCMEDRACRHCEGEWFNFGTLKPNNLFSFSQKDRLLIRRMDPNWKSKK